ncbi:MAG: PTS system mannose/fructose/sorbose family transporter subunit IID [bacterium]|nr:PTS system mannose/fructose/sorbose family transporter subunit IID [bacterium]
MSVQKRITRLTLFFVGLRATCIMAVWNFERMLNIGFTYSLLPVLRRLYPEKEPRARALTRHLQFFNTHPYFASYILGLVAAKEEQLAATAPHQTEAQIEAIEKEIQTIKTSLMGPLGALGDTFFWTTIRPVLALIAVCVVILNIPQWNIAVLGPLFFILWYNVGHSYIRFVGVFRGYKLGGDMLAFIRQFNLAGTVEKIQTVGVGVSGLFLGLSGLYFQKGIPDVNQLILQREVFAIKLLLLSLLLLVGLHKKMHTTRLFLLGLLAISGYELTVQYQLSKIYGFAVVGLVIIVYFTVLFWEDIKGSLKSYKNRTD